MNIYLGYTTAYDYWRSTAAMHPNAYAQGDFINPVSSVLDARTLLESTPFSASEVDIISKCGEYNHCLKGHFHAVKTRFPTGAFVRIAPSVFLSCPELSFLQMAGVLPFEELVLYGCELCAGFARSDFSETGLEERAPLTNAASLEKFIYKMAGAKGAKTARQALPFIHENAASPREIELTLLLSLPYRYGGYSLPAPTLNERIDITAGNAAFASKQFYRADLLWASHKLVVEYDSNLHANPASIASDARRRNALLAMGYTVITVTNEQIKSIAEMHKVAKLVARRLGKRITASRAPDFEEKRYKLRRTILGKK